ncbi:tripartite tricarboxylate transporter substrate binding protein [Microbacteriaceae bacterium K1510]|nr:tripartite tricarboxylate transporter substrate binding protein [Microbacteriaceae bacterium K1510]
MTRLGAPAFADEKWPSKPVRLIVPLAPGGAIDFAARQCGEVLSRQLGQQFFVENRTGAGGTIGMDAAMKAAPDGYTLLVTNDNAASAPHIMKLSYDYTKILLPVIDIGHQPQVFAVHPSLGVNSVAEFVALAKKSGPIGFASSGVGTNQHVVGAWFAREAGISLEHVPYRGAGAAVGDLLAGHVKSAFLGPTALIAHHRDGKIKIIAQTSGKRAPTLPDIPTLEESGYKGLVLEAWYAAFAPPGTPAALISQMNAALGKALTDDKLRANFENGSMEPIGGTPEALGKLAQTDSEKYARLVKELGITAAL